MKFNSRRADIINLKTLNQCFDFSLLMYRSLNSQQQSFYIGGRRSQIKTLQAQNHLKYKIYIKIRTKVQLSQYHFMLLFFYKQIIKLSK